MEIIAIVLMVAGGAILVLAAEAIGAYRRPYHVMTCVNASCGRTWVAGPLRCDVYTVKLAPIFTCPACGKVGDIRIEWGG